MDKLFDKLQEMDDATVQAREAAFKAVEAKGKLIRLVQESYPEFLTVDMGKLRRARYNRYKENREKRNWRDLNDHEWTNAKA